MKAAFLLPLLFVPQSLAAHPHIFVETQEVIVFDRPGHVVGVHLRWRYDAFFTLLVLEDIGIDKDGDGVLTAEEQALLTRRVTDWPPEFTGDLVVELGGQPLGLGAPQQHRVEIIDGEMVETMVRPLMRSVEVDAPLVIRNFDPNYYTAYEVVAPLRMQGGEGCEIAFERADIAKANDEVEELLFGRTAASFGPEEYFPAVGASFADKVTVTCE